MVSTEDFGKGGGGKKAPTKPVKKAAKPRKKAVQAKPVPTKLLIKMQRGSSYHSAGGVSFTKDHPFQLVSVHEAPTLLGQDRFVRASKKEVKEFYGQ